MFAASPLASRPLATSPRPRTFRPAAPSGEYGYAAWSFSKQAKLNSWSWHGIGALLNVQAWATLGNVVYLRNETDNFVYALQADTFMEEAEVNSESTSVEATTQWLDFGKPGRMKALTGIDFDGLNVSAIEVYVSENGGRTGTLAGSIPISDNNGGWTYNGEIIPMEGVGAATEFMLRFVGDGNREVQINRMTLYFDEVQG
jgi:hypothetical protein